MTKLTFEQTKTMARILQCGYLHDLELDNIRGSSGSVTLRFCNMPGYPTPCDVQKPYYYSVYITIWANHVDIDQLWVDDDGHSHNPVSDFDLDECEYLLDDWFNKISRPPVFK